MKKNADRLKRALKQSHDLAMRLDEPDFPLREFEILQDWQRERLALSYADLNEQPRYRAAVQFFLAELYGGLNFRERDAEVERVLPIMIRMLSDDVLAVVAEAFELQSLSLELDMEMAAILQKSGWKNLDPARYGEVYRSCGRRADRDFQVVGIQRLGQALNDLVRHRLILWMVRVMKGPAHAAGFGLLQTFLEQGLTSFRAMGDGTEFVETVYHREMKIRRRLAEGYNDPF